MKSLLLLIAVLAAAGLVASRVVTSGAAEEESQGGSRHVLSAAPSTVLATPAPGVTTLKVQMLLEQAANERLEPVQTLQHPSGHVIAWANVGGPYAPGFLARISPEGQIQSVRECRPISNVTIHRLPLRSQDRFVIVLESGGGTGTGESTYQVHVIDADDLKGDLWHATVRSAQVVDHHPRTIVESNLVLDFSNDSPRILWTRLTVRGEPVNNENRPTEDDAWHLPNLELLESKWDEASGRFGYPRASRTAIMVIDRSH